MTGLEIALLLIGVVFLSGSFFLSEKLSASDIEEIQKLSEKEMHIILEKQLKEASSSIEETIQEKLDQAMVTLEEKSDQETNEKIMAISEYSDTVLDSMNKSHNEVMFMYSMLNEKQEKLTELTKDIQELESSLVQKKSKESSKVSLQKEKEQNIDKLGVENVSPVPKQVTLKEAFSAHVNEMSQDDTRPKNKNEEILKLSQQGIGQMEIAKQLGLGIGEVKLVLGLFEESQV